MSKPETNDDKSTAILYFRKDGSIDVRLTNCKYMNARKLEAGMRLLYSKLNELRAVERRTANSSQPT